MTITCWIGVAVVTVGVGVAGVPGLEGIVDTFELLEQPAVTKAKAAAAAGRRYF
jgi:hypothetical protein